MEKQRESERERAKHESAIYPYPNSLPEMTFIPPTDNTFAAVSKVFTVFWKQDNNIMFRDQKKKDNNF